MSHRTDGQTGRKQHRWTCCATVFLLFAFGVSTAAAKDAARSFDQLRRLVGVGDTVTVTDISGQRMEGTIAELSPSSLGLMVDGKRVDLAEADVVRVSRRDSRWNGTLWGLAVGGGLGAWMEKDLADYYGRDDVGYGSVAVPSAVLGAGIGFTIDALIRGQDTIYSKSPGSTANVTLSGVGNGQGRGVLVSLRYWY